MSLLAEELEKILFPKKAAYDSATFEKLAFDRYRHKIDSSIWEMREDGQLFRVVDDISIKASTEENKWEAIPNKDGSHITLAYKGTPVYSFDPVKYKVDAKDFSKFITEKANNDGTFVEGLLKNMSAERKAVILKIIGSK